MARTYSPEEIDAALVLYKSDGLAAAARELGIPKPTIQTWARKAALPHTDAAAKTAAATEAAKARAAELREGLRLQLLEKAVDLLGRMDEPHIDFKGKDVEQVTYPKAPAAAVQNYAVSVGVLIDKYRLEMGEATDRTESRALTEGLDDHERATLRDAIDRALHDAAQAAEGDPV